MDILQQYVEDNLLSKKNILKYIDDYSLYSYYIGEELELVTKYSSPLREGDEDPSFSLYYSKYVDDKILFKDSALGVYGDVFKFLEQYLGLSTKGVLLQINSDLKLGLDDEEVGAFKPVVLKPRPVKKSPVKIKVTLRDKQSKEFTEYFEALGIPQHVLDMYYARDVEVIHYIYDDGHVTIPARTLTISYEILGHYKIYQPFAERKYKFRNNYLDVYVEGALQLQFKHDFCIITKSTKECMFFRSHFDWDAVAGKSETTKIPAFFIEKLRGKYHQLFIWLDNDQAGQRSQAEYLELYPWLIPIEFDNYIQHSDPTDLYLAADNKNNVIKYLNNLITSKLNG